MRNKRGQVGIEYLMIIGFVTLAIMTTILIAYFYMGGMQDKIKADQVEKYAENIINSADSVFFAGHPTKTSITAYLPDSVNEIKIVNDENGYPRLLVVDYHLSTGDEVVSFRSRVDLAQASTDLDDPSNPFGTTAISKGMKRLVIEARGSDVLIKRV